MTGRAFALTIALTFAAAPAVAADLPVRMPVKAAPPAAAAYAWSGFYVGADVGYAFRSDKYELGPAGSGLGDLDLFGGSGFSGGLLAGYNVIFNQRWLAGIEADWSAQDIETRFSTDPSSGILFDVTVKQKWAASVRGRLGYLITPTTLFYGTAGWAWSNVDFNLSLLGIPFSSSATVNGFQGGFGVETAITSNLHARLEYLQTFYDTAGLGPNINAGLGIKPTVGLARLAAVYQFGAPVPSAAAPVAAVPSWTGFYIGGSLGAAAGYGDVHFDGVGDIKGAALMGPMPSLLAGVNYQFAPRWVIGAEAEIAPSIRSTDLKLGWLGAVRGRLGYLVMPDTMVYGTAGWLGTAVDDLVYQGVVVVAGQNINGVQVGGGIEAAIAPQWDLRFDYQYAIMQKINLTFPAAPGIINATAEPRGQVGRIALIWRFGG